MDELTKSDVQRLKDHLKKLEDPTLSEDDKIAELDEMEMLVESIDNANALASIQGIPKVLALFQDESEDVQMQAVWVIGTSAQNNSRFIDQLLKDGGFEALVGLLESTASISVLSRVVYALSGCVRSSQAAVEKAIAAGTFPKLVALFSKESTDLNLKRKIAFLFSGVLLEHFTVSSLIEHLIESRLLEALADSLKSDDLDLTEKVFEVYEACFSASSGAVAHVKNSALHKQLQVWANKADLPADNKAIIAQTLSKVGVALK